MHPVHAIMLATLCLSNYGVTGKDAIPTGGRSSNTGPVGPGALNRHRRDTDDKTTESYSNLTESSQWIEETELSTSVIYTSPPKSFDKGLYGGPKPLWEEIFDKSQLCMVVIGLVANGVTVITLFKNGKAFQPTILVLLRHQSVIDAWICVIGIAMLVQPYMWKTGNAAFDTFICHVWHGQSTYWGSVFLSVYNLVVIAFERYLAVCKPFSHKDFTKSKIYTVLAVLYVCNFVVISPGYAQVSMKDGHCIPEFLIKGKVGQMVFYGFSIFSFLVWYAVPTLMFILFYGLVIFTFKRRQSEGKFTNSRVIDKATAELTKTAVAVTVIFIVAIGYDLWYYVLGYTGVVDYIKNSPLQKIGVWLASFNSVANPFVYALLMPAYRRSVEKTFFSFCIKSAKPQGVNSENSSSTTVTTVAQEEGHIPI